MDLDAIFAELNEDDLPVENAKPETFFDELAEVIEDADNDNSLEIQVDDVAPLIGMHPYISFFEALVTYVYDDDLRRGDLMSLPGVWKPTKDLEELVNAVPDSNEDLRNISKSIEAGLRAYLTPLEHEVLTHVANAEEVPNELVTKLTKNDLDATPDERHIKTALRDEKVPKSNVLIARKILTQKHVVDPEKVKNVLEDRVYTRFTTRMLDRSISMYEKVAGGRVVKRNCDYRMRLIDTKDGNIFFVTGQIHGMLHRYRRELVLVEFKNRKSCFFTRLPQYEFVRILVLLAMTKMESCNVVQCLYTAPPFPKVQSSTVKRTAAMWNTITQRLFEVARLIIKLRKDKDLRLSFLSMEPLERTLFLSKHVSWQ